MAQLTDLEKARRVLNADRTRLNNYINSRETPLGASDVQMLHDAAIALAAQYQELHYATKPARPWHQTPDGPQEILENTNE